MPNATPIAECVFDPCDGIAIQHEDRSVVLPAEVDGTGTTAKPPSKPATPISPKPDSGIQFKTDSMRAATEKSRGGGFAFKFNN